MKGILRRPLALGSALFLLLLFLFLTLPGLATLALPAGILCLIAALFTLGAVLLFLPPTSSPAFRRGLWLTAGLLFAASIALFSVCRVTEYGQFRKAEPYDGTIAEAELTVTEVEATTAYSTAVIGKLHTLDGQSVELYGRLNLPYAAALSAGDRIALAIEFTALSPIGDDWFDRYDYSQGLAFIAKGMDEDYRLLSHSDRTLSVRLETFRTFLRRQFYPYLSIEETGPVSALLMGDRRYLSGELSQQFRNLGISHTLAVSGLHLGILCGSLLWLLKKLRLPQMAKLPILLPLLLIYMVLVGSPSVFRAGGMLLFTFLAYPAGRRRDPITSLFVTVAAICLLSPESVLDVGLLLSFFATYGILLIALPLGRRIQSLPSLLRLPLSALAVTGAATLFTLPFSVWCFGEWSILSPLANLVLVPIVTLLLYLAPILLILSPFPPLAALPAQLIRGLIKLLGLAGDLFGGSDHLLLPLSYPTIQTMATIAIVLVTVLCLLPRTRPLSLAVAVVFLGLAGGYCTIHANNLLDRQSVLPLTDVGNDCLLVQAGTRTMLVDHSEGGYDFLAEIIAAEEDDPLVRVDALMLTHYHYRQISAVTYLLPNGHLEYLILPTPCEEDRNIADTLAQRAQHSGCKVRWYSADQPVVVYHNFEVEADFLGRDDHPLAKITVRCGGKQFVYSADVTGDFSKEALQGTHERPAIHGDDPRWGKLIPFPSA
ncbi:MAG: ComEC/Rec2 family competence protein [Clostridia bacterium]|nr:ComEC/Rec2 family competence protein [Clostridia bacterium]